MGGVEEEETKKKREGRKIERKEIRKEGMKNDKAKIMKEKK